MFSQINKPGQHMPNHPSDEFHRPNHPEKPNPPVRPGHSNPPGKPNEPITIIVNGVDKVLPIGTNQLSYDEVVKLAYPNYSDTPNVVYTVVFSNGPVENKKGTLVKGDIIRIQKGMIFNVGKSNKS